jgi:AcrR family transcriptional regulator
MGGSESTTQRRMGPSGAATWHLIIDGAEAILLEEGYAGLTSRRIANRVGIRQQLVYYYFRTMDDLVVEAFRRLSKRELERLDGALASERPVHEIWNVCVHTSDARLISEFMALANRIEGVRTEVIAYVEESRRLQVAALTKAAAQRDGGIVDLPPAAVILLANSLALAITREASIGVSMGHAEIEQVIEQALQAFEP